MSDDRDLSDKTVKLLKIALTSNHAAEEIDSIISRLGITGPTGVMGPTGPAGSATGPTGPVGEVGPTGATGLNGQDGSTGPTGPMGDQGFQGNTGPTGVTGADGLQGPTGIKGDVGIAGPTGSVGPTGPVEDTGVVADLYGSSTQIPTFNVNSKGQITSAQNVNLETIIASGQVKYVNVATGNDSSGDGSFPKPFASITAAQNSISDSSPTKRYVILVEAGNYSESVALKANVFIVGRGQKESVRITGAVSMGSSFTANSSFDNRSGFSKLTLLSACNFNWNTVQSAAGKLYFNEVVFASTVDLYGYNNATAQAQIDSCIIFGALTVSGINLGVFTNNVCYSNITLNQHPNSGMATILLATGGYCGGTVRHTTTVNDFSRRCASFLRGFWSENLIVDGPSSYSDVDLNSGSKQGAQSLNGGSVVALNPIISHDLTTQMLTPRNTNAHNLGDWGKQWNWSFAYVHASSGTDCYLISYPSAYAPDSVGREIGIYTDGAGLQDNVNGGSITLETAITTGTGVRGKIILNGKEIDVTSKQIKNLANGTDPQDAATKAQVDLFLNPKGATGSRPSSPAQGQPFFDTTLGIPIWYNGSNWVNSSGTIV